MSKASETARSAQAHPHSSRDLGSGSRLRLTTAGLLGALLSAQTATADPLPQVVQATGPTVGSTQFTSSWVFHNRQIFSIQADFFDAAPDTFTSDGVTDYREGCNTHFAGFVALSEDSGFSSRTNFNASSVTVAGNSVTAGPNNIYGLQVTYEFTVIDGPGVARGFLTLQNPTPAEKTIFIQGGSDLSLQDVVAQSSSGDATFSANDRWIVAQMGGFAAICTDRLGAFPTDTLVFFGEGANVTPYFVNKFNDIYVARYEVTVPAGSTRHLMWFLAMHPDTPSALSDVTIFDTPDATLLSGLTSDEFANTVNWSLVFDGDGDGVFDDIDNCPDIANPDQADADNDGIGDVCEPDSDGDGVIDDDDNCVSTPNANQLDTDGNGQGDACDTDDDGDGVNDGADNCPLVPNADQADFDSDGQGDACDADVDGDGLNDAEDLCLGTAPGEVTDAGGCSIAQLCPCENPSGWKNHGEYVKCVAHTSENFLDLGLITEAQKDAIVSAAGESQCGHKK